MSRINTNVSSIIAQRILTRQNNALTLSLERLSTGMRINRGKDDPAGLIASERMRAEMAAVEAAQYNIMRATQMVAVAESGLTEISNLMNDLEELIDLSANDAAVTDDEIAANQLEIDAILESINRIANTTELQGKKLLNGDLAYRTSGVKVSQIAGLRINSARIGDSPPRSVNIDVVQTASTAFLTYTGGDVTGSTRTVEVVGNLGREIFSFASGTSVTNIASAINQSVMVTGVSAVASTAGVQLFSTEYGSDQFVRVRLLSGSSFAMSGNQYEDYGGDVVARINGMTSNGDGLKVSLRTSSLALDAILTVDMATQTATTASFDITGGGAAFAITPQLDQASMGMLGIDSVATTSLGDNNTGLLYTLATGQANALREGNYREAQEIVRLAATQIAALRGRLGAFEADTLDTTLNSLKIQYENIAAAESAIRDTDFASETANLTRAQILVQAATMVLQQANSAPQNVLALLQ